MTTFLYKGYSFQFTMKKIHTRVKRTLGLNTNLKHRYRSVKGKNGARTFSTSDRATEYAKTVLNLNESSYTLAPAKKNKRFKIIINHIIVNK